MRELKFKYAKARNFLCYGPEEIEINFEKLGNIVVVLAKNLDVHDNDSSNGAGKSSLPNLVIYALFGKTLKNMNQEEIINHHTGKDLMVEFCWDDYRVVRTREPNSLKLWQSPEGIWNKETELTRGGKINGKPATQYLIESAIGLSYETFINLYVFSDDPALSFLESDLPTKREIIENLLSLGKYRQYFENAKSYVKVANAKIKKYTKEYETALKDTKSAIDRLDKVKEQERVWQDNKQKELGVLLNLIKKKRDELDSTNNGVLLANYKDAQERIISLKNEIPILEQKKAKLNDILVQAADKLTTIFKKYTELKTECDKQNKIVNECDRVIKENETIVKSVKSKTGKECPYCLNMVDESKFANMLQTAGEEIKKQLEKHKEATDHYAEFNKEFIAITANKDKVEKGILDYRRKTDELNKKITDSHTAISELSKIKEPDSSADERRISEQLEELKKRVEAKELELCPLEVTKTSLEKELEEKQQESEKRKIDLDEVEKELPYYEFWVKAFGDGGIRKYIVDGIIPSLNARIAHWLQFLIDNKIKLEFDSELKETIDRWPFCGKPYVYHGLSGGQRRRLNLTVSQAFAHIMMLNTGCSPSVVWLDEVTMNMDTVGVEGIYRMICELSKDKQVFVIDHNETLLRFLDGCDTIRIEMKDEIAKVVK